MEQYGLVDTNVVSYIFRGDTRAAQYTQILASFRYLAISFQTLAELHFWARKNDWGRRRKADLSLHLERYDIILCDERTCEIWLSVKAERQSKGSPIHPEDAWIAATALDLGCPLITHDAGDFADIPGLRVITSKGS